MEEKEDIPMIPRIGDSYVDIPMTFDFKGGRGSQVRARFITGISVFLVTIFLVVLIMASDSSVIFKIFWSVVLILVSFFGVRFFVAQEGFFRETYVAQKETDYALDPEVFWGIYDVESNYPHFVSYRNGRIGLFVLLERDAVVGKEAKEEFNHYTAHGDALKILGNADISVAILDIVEEVGKDARLDANLDALQNCSNPDIKQVLTDVFLNLREQMSLEYTTQEVFVFTYAGNQESFWDSVNKFISKITEGNYKSYKILNQNQIRELVSTIYNLNDFSVNEAMTKVFSSSEEKIVVPLRLLDGSGGMEVLNESSQERKERLKRESQRNAAKASARSRMKKDKGRRLGPLRKKVEEVPEEEIELF